MVQRDYLMRMIEQFVQAIARILGLAKDGRLEEAKTELDAAYAKLGISRSMIERLDAASLRLLLGEDKLRIVAMLFGAEAKLLRLEGKEQAAHSLDERAREIGGAAGG